VGIVREVMTASVRRTVTREAGRIAFMGCGIFFETTGGRRGKYELYGMKTIHSGV
jgi:hypothetical protein